MSLEATRLLTCVQSSTFSHGRFCLLKRVCIFCGLCVYFKSLLSDYYCIKVICCHLLIQKMPKVPRLRLISDKTKRSLREQIDTRIRGANSNTIGCILIGDKNHYVSIGITDTVTFENYGKQKTEFTADLHQVVYFLHTGKSSSVCEKNDVSHLCNQKNCINIGHLHLEPHKINCSRIRCSRGVSCVHTPSCI